ncbi:hypothetical protein QTO34_013397, partial [Cnephaeus nilssonii]
MAQGSAHAGLERPGKGAGSGTQRSAAPRADPRRGPPGGRRDWPRALYQAPAGSGNSSSGPVQGYGFNPLVRAHTRINLFGSEKAVIPNRVHPTPAASTMQLKFDPNEIKVIYPRCTSGEVGATSALAPKIGPLGLSPKKNRGPDGSSASAFALIIKALKEPPRDRKKQKQNKTLSTVQISLLPRLSSLPNKSRELSGTITEILGTAQSGGCNVDGRHPHDIIDVINSGAALKNK